MPGDTEQEKICPSGFNFMNELSGIKVIILKVSQAGISKVVRSKISYTKCFKLNCLMFATRTKLILCKYTILT